MLSVGSVALDDLCGAAVDYYRCYDTHSSRLGAVGQSSPDEPNERWLCAVAVVETWNWAGAAVVVAGSRELRAWAYVAYVLFARV